jgi:hypothetical protein
MQHPLHFPKGILESLIRFTQRALEAFFRKLVLPPNTQLRSTQNNCNPDSLANPASPNSLLMASSIVIYPPSDIF